MGLQIVHLQAESEPCGGRAQIELVGHSQPESSGRSCHFMQTLHSCLRNLLAPLSREHFSKGTFRKVKRLGVNERQFGVF